MTSGSPPPTSRQQGTWYSFNAPYERLKLFSPWAIVGFGLAIGLGLVLVYPQTSLQQRLSASNASAHPDQLTVEYLKVFLKAEPTANALRFELVQQLIALGAFDEARAQLMQLNDRGDTRLEAAWFEYQIRQQELYAEVDGSPRRTQRWLRLQQQLRVLLSFPLRADKLLRLAQRALAQGDSDTARLALQRLLQSREPMTVADASASALHSLGLGDYHSAAAFYFRAMQASTTLDAQRDFYMRALRSLQAGGLYSEVVPAADRYLGGLGQDKPTLLFLARLAQSSNQLDAAERYVKQLLKLSMLERLAPAWPRLAQWATMRDWRATLVASARTVMLKSDLPHVLLVAAPQALVTNLPFDQQTYVLSYNIFVANGNLSDARLLAQSALRQQADDALWHQRLAQVSEWGNLPLEAIPQWLAYARLSGDEAGWDAVLRLSQDVFDQSALQAALEHKLQSEPNNPVWLKRWLDQQEYAGDPRRAIDFLKRRLVGVSAAHNRFSQAEQRMGEQLLELYLRIGADDDALRTLRSLQSQFGPRADYALQIANLLYRRGRIEAALAALQQASASTPAENREFWRTYAEVAHFVQNDAQAVAGYRQLLSANLQDENDLGNLIALIEDKQPLAAANLAEAAFAGKGTINFAVQALTFRLRVADLIGAQHFLDGLSDAQRRQLEANSSFLGARSGLKQAQHHLPEAIADLRAALLLRPADMELRAGLMWLLIAAHDADALKRALRLWAADAEINSALWGPFAAANMSLNRQPTALHWFRKAGFLKDDYLWLMSYAECLDGNGYAELAWRIRRKVWDQVRQPAVLRQLDPAQWRDWRDRLAALAPLFLPADAGQSVIQALLHADLSQLTAPLSGAARDGPALLRAIDQYPAPMSSASSMVTLRSWFAPGDGQRPRDDLRLSASVRELALGYALSSNQSDLARAWLSTRFAQQLERPLWGELALLLAADDRQALDKMLDAVPDWLPMYDRIEAAKQTGRVGLAQSMAFDQLAVLPYDDELHLRLSALSTEAPPPFSAAYTRSSTYPLQSKKFEAISAFDLTPGTRLLLGLRERLQSSSDTTQLDNLPRRDAQVELTLRQRTDSGFVSASVLHRQAAAAVNGARIDFSSAESAKLTLGGSVGIHQEASESALLLVGAMRSGAELNANYALSRTEYSRFGLGWQQYSSQAGTTLGNGRSWNVEVGTYLRQEYPNLTLRGFVSGALFSANGRSDAQLAQLAPVGSDPNSFRFMPLSSRIYGVSLGLGTVTENVYTRAWRPFVEFGLTYTPVTGIGWGRNLRGGLAGSVLGQDVLSIGMQTISATANTPQKSLELGVNYKWFY